MALADLTKQAVMQAIAEFDAIKRDAFLERYGFGKSRGYFLVHNGDQYDSKAIAGAAHRYLGDSFKALRASEFSGGDKSVAKRLRELGFTINEPSTQQRVGIPFEIGKLYHRQRDIHQVFGGQERGGIATPDGIRFLFLFTGDTGGQYGYSDGWRTNGTFAYTGEVQKGDMTFVRGNKAIRDHAKNGRELLLFEATRVKGIYRFEGCFAFAGWDLVDAPDREGNQRKAIVFELVPVADAELAHPTEASEAESLKYRSLAELRAMALEAAETPSKAGKEARRTYYVRSAKVKAYVLKRANGRCESCKQDAPFARKDGTPYLEPHHIRRVADGGPDHPRHVGAICPTCHRHIHHGDGGSDLNASLELYIAQIEDERDESSGAH